MADILTLNSDEKDIGKIVKVVRQLVERLQPTEDSASAAAVATVQIIAGSGLTGGGTLEADRTLNVGAGTGLTIAADAVGLSDMAQATVKGRASGAGTGAPGDLTGSQLRTIAGVEYGLQTIWIPASSMTPQTAGGATALALNTWVGGANNTTIPVLDYTTAGTSRAWFHIAMPKSWDESTVTFIPYWTAAAGSGDVVWQFAAAAQSDNEALAALSSAVTSTDTLLNVDRVHVGPTTSALTIASSPAEGDLSCFGVLRDPSHASDTLSDTARLIGVKLLYTVNAGNDI